MTKFTLSPKEDNTTTFSVRVKDTLLSRYVDLSRVTRRSRNELVNIAMEYFIDNVEVEIQEEE